MADKPIAKGPKKPVYEAYELQRDIVIPAGTIFRVAGDTRGGSAYVECPIGHGKDFTSYLVVQVCADAVASGDFKSVISAG